MTQYSTIYIPHLSKIQTHQFLLNKEGCVIPMVDRLLPRAEFGSVDHQKDAPHFRKTTNCKRIPRLEKKTFIIKILKQKSIWRNGQETNIFFNLTFDEDFELWQIISGPVFSLWLFPNSIPSRESEIKIDLGCSVVWPTDWSYLFGGWFGVIANGSIINSRISFIFVNFWFCFSKFRGFRECFSGILNLFTGFLGRFRFRTIIYCRKKTVRVPLPVRAASGPVQIRRKPSNLVKALVWNW